MTMPAELPEAPAVPRLEGVSYRTIRDSSDYGRLAELERAAYRHDDIPLLPTESDLRAELEGRAGLDPARDVMLAELDGGLVGMTSVQRVVRDGQPVYEMDGAVRPEVRRRGVGTALLQWTVERARQRAAVEDPGVDVAIAGGAEEQETAHRVLLERDGFEPVRHFFLMRRPTLDDIPEARIPDGLEIRRVTEDERRRIVIAEFEAFKDHWGHREITEESITLTLGRPQLDTDLWVVAWDGDQVAGVVENWIWAEENEGLGVKRGWLERISVRRQWRRRGLARAITAESLRRLRAVGMDEAMLGVDSENANGALRLYEGLGFEVHSRSAAYRRPLDQG